VRRGQKCRAISDQLDLTHGASYSIESKYG